jgi:hypothetical protein
MEQKLEKEDKRISKLVESLEFDEQNRIMWNILFKNIKSSNKLNDNSNKNKFDFNFCELWTQIKDNKSQNN